MKKIAKLKAPGTVVSKGQALNKKLFKDLSCKSSQA